MKKFHTRATKDFRNFSKPLWDISVNGVSFLCNKTERDYFDVGDLVPEAQLQIGEALLNTEMEVVSVSEIDPNEEILYPCWKVSFKFNNELKKIKNFEGFLKRNFVG